MPDERQHRRAGTRRAAAAAAARALAAARTLTVVLGCVLALAACGGALREAARGLAVPGRAAVVTTAGPNASMIYLARVDSGIVVVDLGWLRAEAALDRGLRELGATRRDVRAVFLTHSHRDHIGAWRAVADAPFHLGTAEAPRLLGRARHRGWVPRVVERAWRTRGPRPGEVEIRPIARDTAFVFGADTVRAFSLPGHTAGSVAYLVHGVLFVGDGASHRVTGGLRPARAGYSDDTALARESLGRLRAALAAHEVRLICTAHARCAPATAAVWWATTAR